MFMVVNNLYFFLLTAISLFILLFILSLSLLKLLPHEVFVNMQLTVRTDKTDNKVNYF